MKEKTHPVVAVLTILVLGFGSYILICSGLKAIEKQHFFYSTRHGISRTVATGEYATAGGYFFICLGAIVFAITIAFLFSFIKEFHNSYNNRIKS